MIYEEVLCKLGLKTDFCINAPLRSEGAFASKFEPLHNTGKANKNRGSGGRVL